ncbi:hypothetical protein L210DRAFT_2619475 [Boletus edulis BED1]|uniref:Uncharacterized protein n=1 Tax=Boletus edulis BED1 TaxID=1328754 RepID=A0AAD4C506_BOLED|nr:hypothetical protein L210DRAFT_2619475 [Boletus edulis BED1]
MSSSKGVETRSESKQQAGRSSKPKTRPRPPRAPPTHSPFVCGPLTRHTATGGPEAGATGAAASYQQSHPFSQNQTQPHSQLHPQTEPYSHSTQNLLLGLLSAIPFTSPSDTVANTTPEQQAVFLSALQGLLANPHLLQLATTSTGLSASSGQKTAENKPVCGGSNADDDADSDIVILDSSTIDTTAFRKPNHRQLTASDNDTTGQESPMPSGEGTDLSPLPAGTPPSEQEDAPASSQTLTPSVTPKAETPTLKYVSVGRTERGNETSSHPLDIDMPATPTPSRARKRKLDEYTQGEAQLSTSTSPPSPSPSSLRTSNPGRALITRRVLSSPTRKRKLVSSPTVRLPSMMDSMRSTATSGSRLQVSSSSFSTHGRSASLATNKNADQSGMLGSGPLKSKGDHPDIMTAPSNIASGKTSLKRRLNLNLNEFMEEREARKNTKVRKRPSSGRKLETEGSNASQAGPSLSANLVSTLRHTQSSPSRPFCWSHAVASSPPSACQPLSVLGAAVSSPVSLSATTSTSTAPNPLKNFVLPAWARTSTSMLPRLSDEVLARQRAEREAKEAQISLRRREAAKAKRRRLCAAERLSKESSDEDDAVANDPIPRTLQSSSIVTRSAPLMAPPPPSLPVFASDAVEPIPSSPPQSHRHPAPSVAPSTPPRKSLSPGSAPYRTPSKSGSCSLFTPSGQDPESLFTPSTPSVTLSFTRVTPRSPTLFHRSGAKKSPRKSVPQTPKRNSINHQTPRSSRSGRNAPFVSPNLAMRPPQSRTGMGTRAFLLPPSSPCMLRTPHRQNQMRSEVPEASAPIVPGDSGIVKQESPSEKQNVEKGIDVLGCEMKGALLEKNPSIPPVECSPTRLIGDDNQETNELRDIASNGDGSQVGEEYASSPLPPSSPLPCSPSSSPARHHDSDFDTPTINNFVVPDSDILLPSASDSDASRGPADTTWLSDDACATSWFTDPETSAWLTETETWLTDTEGGGPLLTDSDGAWLSDSDAIFGDMSSLPPSSASNWLSDDADVDTDGEVGQGQDGGFDTAAFERAFAALVERGGRSIGSNGEGNGSSSGATIGTHGTGEVEPEFWASMQPLLGANLALDDASLLGAMTGGAVGTNDKDKVVQGIQGLLDGSVG